MKQPADNATFTDELAARLVLPVIEEHLTVGTETVETGRVRLTRTVAHHEEQVRLALMHDEVQVERVARNEYLPAGATAPAIRYEGEVMVVPVLHEVAVVEKRLLLVEELHIRRTRRPTDHAEAVTLRRENIAVERVPAAAAPDLDVDPAPAASPAPGAS